MIDEGNFIEKLKKKNPKALEFIVDVYGDLVYKVAYSVLGNSFQRESLEECVNDVFMAIWNHIDSFKEEKGSFKSWIIAITRYKAIDYIRKLCKEENFEYMEEVISKKQYDTENLVILHENKREILKAIYELREIDRTIFIKRYLLGEEIECIASELGVNRSVIDNRLSRGRKILKDKLTFLREEIV